MRRVLVLLLAVGLVGVLCAAQTKVVEVMHGWPGEQAPAFEMIVEAFEAEHPDIDVVIEIVGRDRPAILATRLAAGNPPDLTPHPWVGTMRQWADAGAIVNLAGLVDTSDINPALIPIGEYKGGLYGLFIFPNVKSLVWYDPREFGARGYEIPGTWFELQALSETILADGGTPWSIGLESGAASGWPGTDWIEDIMLRTAGADVYDKWVNHEIPWTDPRVKRAFEIFGQLFERDHVLGGPIGALTTNFGDAADPLFIDPPAAFMHHQATFIQGFFNNHIPGLEAGEDYAVFPLPTINPKATPDGSIPLLVSGDVVTVFDDRPEVIAFAEFLTTETAAEIWSRELGELSAYVNADPAGFENPITRQAQEMLLNATVSRFDGSDLMPAEVGAGAFWSGVLDYISGIGIDTVLSSIESAAVDAYGPIAQVDQAQATEIVIAELAEPSEAQRGLRVHAYPYLIPAGTEVTPYYDWVETKEEGYVCPEDCWFFWLDYDPLAQFAHETVYAFVDASTGKLTTRKADWWPVVGDTVVWGSTAERASDEMLVFEKTVDLNLRTDWKHDFSSLVAQSTPGCDVWAVLVCGSNDPGNTFEEDTRYLYNVFKGLGYPDSNIFYISPFTSDPGVDRVTSTANAAWAAAQVAANSNASDIVFYFYSAHGNTDYLECYPGSTGGGYVYASTMDGWLDAITARHITVMLQGCRTGSFIGAYSTGTTVPSENDLTGGGETNRIAITATDSTHSSYGGSSSWGSTFTGGYVASFSDPTADTDSSGSISVGEAYDYALAHDSAAIAGNSFPQIDPTSLDPDDVFHTCESVDLWISDGPTDTGNNSYDYASTDIWSTLTVSGTTHVDPVSGLTNYVHVRVHNLGTTSVSNVDVDLYWADTSTALAWPASFNQIGSTYTLSSIAAGGSAEIVWSWTVDPAWGLGHHFCFVATADATADPMTGGPAGITYVAPYDNNIAQRNVTIVASQAGQMAQAAFQIANIVEQGAPFDLVLDTSTLPSGAMVTLVLPEDLRGRILQKSGGLEGFEANAATGELMVLNERSIIRDIVLDPEERKTVVFRIRMAEDVQPGQEFVVRVFQTVKSEVVGANTFVLRVVPPGDCLTVLTEAVEVFAQIAFRFGIESAAHLVEVIGEALAGEICNEPEAIVEWKRNIFPLEKDVVEALRGRIPDEALRMLYIALDKLASAIDSGDPREVMIAQELLIKALKNSLP